MTINSFNKHNKKISKGSKVMVALPKSDVEGVVTDISKSGTRIMYIIKTNDTSITAPKDLVKLI